VSGEANKKSLENKDSVPILVEIFHRKREADPEVEWRSVIPTRRSVTGKHGVTWKVSLGG